MEIIGLEASISFNKGFSKQEFKSSEGKLTDECDFDETEDEEVKVNCEGRTNVYTTTSEEEDSEDDGESTIHEESEEEMYVI